MPKNLITISEFKNQWTMMDTADLKQAFLMPLFADCFCDSMQGKFCYMKRTVEIQAIRLYCNTDGLFRSNANRSIVEIYLPISN